MRLGGKRSDILTLLLWENVPPTLVLSFTVEIVDLGTTPFPPVPSPRPRTEEKTEG